MEYKFRAYGHSNITSKHKTTLEFTKDKDLSLSGDCIVGVKADFSLNEIKNFIKSLKSKKIKIILELKDIDNKDSIEKILLKEINKIKNQLLDSNKKNSISKKSIINNNLKIKKIIEKLINDKLLKNLIKNKFKIIKEVIIAEINPDFNDNEEIVIRKSGFIDKRTFAISANKSASELNQEFVKCLTNKEHIIEVKIKSF